MSDFNDAILNGDLDLLNIYIELGIDVNDLINGQTPLLISLLNHHFDIAKALLMAGADVNIRGLDGLSPLIQSIEIYNQAPDIFDDILSKTTDINAYDDEWGTPLILAIDSNNMNLIDKLINAGANINATDKNGNTPLIVASRRGNSRIVKKLLQLGANINQYNNDNVTPLSTATSNGRLKVVEILTKAGADPTIPTKKGKLPKDYDFYFSRIPIDIADKLKNLIDNYTKLYIELQKNKESFYDLSEELGQLGITYTFAYNKISESPYYQKLLETKKILEQFNYYTIPNLIKLNQLLKNVIIEYGDIYNELISELLKNLKTGRPSGF